MSNWLITYMDGTAISRYLQNTVDYPGTPIVEIERLADGQEVAMWYDLTFENVIPGVSADCVVEAATANVSQHGRTVSVTLDGAWNSDVVRGYRIKFSNAGGFLSTWKARLWAGPWRGAAYAGNPTGETYSEVDGPDDPGLLTGQGAGAPAYIGQFRCRNTSGKRAIGGRVRLIPVAIDKPVTGNPISYQRNTDVHIVEKSSGAGEQLQAYVLTIANRDEGPPVTVDLLVDGALYPSGVQDTTSSAAPTSSAALEVNVKYRITSGALKGWEFKIATSAANGDRADLFVWGVKYHEITPSSGGLPVSRTEADGGDLWGTDDYSATQEGEPVGQVENNGEIVVYTKSTLPDGAAYAQSPVPQCFTIEAGFALPSGV